MWKAATEFIMLDRDLVRQVFDLEWKYPIVKPSQQHNIWDLPHTAPGTHLSSSIEILIMHLWIQTLVSTWLQIHDHILLGIVIRAEFCCSFHDNLNQTLCLSFFLPEFQNANNLDSILLSLWEKPLCGKENNFSMSFIFLFPDSSFIDIFQTDVTQWSRAKCWLFLLGHGNFLMFCLSG